MKTRPKTIQIFLPSGDPQGIRIAEITTRIVQVVEIPRTLLDDFYKLPEADQVAFYFLFGESAETEQRVYIGQTGDLKSRLRAHNKEKDFWQRALIAVSKTNNLTQTHAIFLEWYCLQEARNVGRFSDENGNSGTKPYTPPPLEADCLEIFDTTKTLVSSLGYPVFDPLVGTSKSEGHMELWYCQSSDADGRGMYTEEGFVVLKGSSGRAENVPSIGVSGAATRERLVEQGVCKIDQNRYKFERDHLFSSPSTAAMAVMGRSANGWVEWKDREGRTLDEMKRQIET